MTLDFAAILSQIGEQITKGGSPKAVRGAGSPISPIVQHYAILASRIAVHAAKWAAISGAGAVCTIVRRANGGVVRCSQRAISPCLICRQMACFEHSLISPMDGNVVCFSCARRAQEELQEPMTGGPHHPQHSHRHPPSSNGHQHHEGWQAYSPSGSNDGWSGRAESTAEGPPTKSELRIRYLSALDLEDPVDDQEIKRSYKELVVRFHPDKAQTAAAKRSCEKRMREINQAYEWLIKRKQRAET